MNRSSRTSKEQTVIDTVAERKGEEWAEKHSELILLQARRVGLLKSDTRRTEDDPQKR